MNKFESNKPTTKLYLDEEKRATNTTPGPLPDLIDGVDSTQRTNNAKEHIYQYGIKDISLTNSTYQNTGVFVTKPIEVEGNIMEVSLSTIEDHPLFNELDGMATDRLSSIEYYVALEENPSLNDWVPILPENTKVVKCEKLFFQGLSAKLRFHADIKKVNETKVYKNNILMDPSEWYFTARGASIQLAIKHESNALYTIDYVPDEALVDPWTVKVGTDLSKQVRMVENFENGTDYNNTIQLSKYPYINYEEINKTKNYDPNTNSYRPVDVFLLNASIVAPDNEIKKEMYPMSYGDATEFVTKNRTDYTSRKDPSLKKYSIDPENEYHIVEYKQEKNKLIFTESFNRSDLYYNEATNHGNATISVHYDYLVTNFRLKIILRKNTGDDLVLTPVVNEYQLKIKVMK